jgi:hypothetical protein
VKFISREMLFCKSWLLAAIISTLKTLFKVCCAGDGSQRGAAADPSLDSPSATRASRYFLQNTIDMNVSGEDRPSMA